MVYRPIHRQWRTPKRAFYIPLIFELGATVGLLILFGIAQPDLFRTQLWQAGADLNFNSSPVLLLYAYANHEPLPQIPFVWSLMLTNFNVAISVISLFVLIVKLVAFIMNVWFPIICTVFYVVLSALYATSVYGQAGPDNLDPDFPSSVAWYIAKPCTVAANQSIQSSCRVAKGTFATTVFMLAVCVFNLGYGIYSMLPNELDNAPQDSDDDDAGSFNKETKIWEMGNIPPTPRTGTMPYTPRTMAFNTLDRQLPLRQYR
ncbi:uncharacterized protein B0I36DRAFT_143295 [Microdochium trichocladiopsis]|uniref:Uncharacterized protein n=1 Tax=Microdochium trichocladiopsis TaxID=1682393 RepID=A0A9P8Y4G8_9PEZI|nr:uncharacterized protein B0I36DRAFT_143295 [Microdochium trichocladiopsis]KAH7027777.1 hypothetical protein B0I36DRAFT_143295 [Microdochium trichocladiopsis]